MAVSVSIQRAKPSSYLWNAAKQEAYEECTEAVLSKQVSGPLKFSWIQERYPYFKWKVKTTETLRLYLCHELKTPTAVNAFTMAGVLEKSAAARILNRQ